jgi:hypothetical protein
MSAIDIFLAKGTQGLLLHKDQLTREEKDILRERFGAEGTAGVWFLETQLDTSEKAATEPDQDGDEPTMEDLEKLTVVQLKDLAAKDNLDIAGLTLKADLLGRLAAHYGIEV